MHSVAMGQKTESMRDHGRNGVISRNRINVKREHDLKGVIESRSSLVSMTKDHEQRLHSPERRPER